MSSRASLWLPRVVRGLIVLAPFALLMWAVNQHFFLTKSVAVAFTPGTDGRAVRLDAVDDVVASRVAGRLRWRLARDAVPFTVRVPRAVERLDVRTWLENVDQPVVVLAAQGRTDVGVIRRVLNYDFLNTLPWPRVTDGRLTLWQRGEPAPNADSPGAPRRYATVQEFLENPPDLERVGYLGPDPFGLFRIPGYKAAESELTLPGRYRGRHRLLVYVQNETLTLELFKNDLNRTDGPDGATLTVLRGDAVVRRITVSDDGIADASGRAGRPQAVRLEVRDLPVGLYRVDLEASEDVVFDRLRTRQHYLAFIDSVFLAGGPAYGPELNSVPVRFSAGGLTVTVVAPHREGLQNVWVNGVQRGLARVGQPVTASLRGGRGTVRVERGDVSMAVSGQAFKQKSQRVLGESTTGTLDPSNIHRLYWAISNRAPTYAEVQQWLGENPSKLEGYLRGALTSTTEEAPRVGFLTPEPAKRFDVTPKGVTAPVGAVELPLVSRPDTDHLEYILAEYQPRQTAGRLTDALEFGGGQLLVTGGGAHFLLSAPGLQAGGRVLRLDRIEVRLTRGPLAWDRGVSRLQSGLSRLFHTP